MHRVDAVLKQDFQGIVTAARVHDDHFIGDADERLDTSLQQSGGIVREQTNREFCHER
jgi:hypothetical protein